MSIQPIPSTFQLVDAEGRYTPEFKRYLDALLSRVGGVSGGSLSQLTDGATIVWDVEKYSVAFVVLAGNRTLAVANQVRGNLIPYRLIVAQDNVGGRTLSWGGFVMFSGGVPITVTSAANARDEFLFTSDGSKLTLVGGAQNVS